eukprot:scaffold4873_cov113-Skeletonema_menzelii.AAC.1
MAQKQKHFSDNQSSGRAPAVPLKGLRKSKNSVELVSPTDNRFRSQVLASVGLDDDDDDDSYDKCDDIEEAESQRLDDRNKSGFKRKIKKSGEDIASENIELLEEEEDDNDGECNSLDQSNNSTSANRCSTLKPICNKLIWIMLTVAA